MPGGQVLYFDVSSRLSLPMFSSGWGRRYFICFRHKLALATPCFSLCHTRGKRRAGSLEHGALRLRSGSTTWRIEHGSKTNNQCDTQPSRKTKPHIPQKGKWGFAFVLHRAFVFHASLISEGFTGLEQSIHGSEMEKEMQEIYLSPTVAPSTGSGLWRAKEDSRRR